MAKPVILVVDPNPEVLWAIKDDLQRQYEDSFQVLRAGSDTTALETLKKLNECSECVTLFVVEQQRSQMTGTEFLEAAKKVFPKAKQVLLTLFERNDTPVRVPLQKAVVIR